MCVRVCVGVRLYVCQAENGSMPIRPMFCSHARSCVCATCVGCPTAANMVGTKAAQTWLEHSHAGLSP